MGQTTEGDKSQRDEDKDSKRGQEIEEDERKVARKGEEYGAKTKMVKEEEGQ